MRKKRDIHSSKMTIEKDEEDANLTITNLINDIEMLNARNDPLIRSIKSPTLLISGLIELRSLVEMIDINHSIVNQIKFLISNEARKNIENKSKFEGHM